MARECQPANELPRSQLGFTLIEVMITLFCFTVVALALSYLSSNTWRSVAQAKTKTEASVLASGVLESIISRKYRDDAVEVGSHHIADDNYIVDYTVSDDAILPRTKYVQVNISYNLGSSVKNVRLHYLLPEYVD